MQFMIQLNNTAIDLLFLAYVNDIWKNIESNIRPFADDCVIYRMSQGKCARIRENVP